MKEYSIDEFANIMGISRQRLSVILKTKHDVPPFNVTVSGKRQHITIPEREGVLWLWKRDPERAEALVWTHLEVARAEAWWRAQEVGSDETDR